MTLTSLGFCGVRAAQAARLITSGYSTMMGFPFNENCSNVSYQQPHTHDMMVSYFISIVLMRLLTYHYLLRSRVKLTNKLKHCRIPLFQPYLPWLTVSRWLRADRRSTARKKYLPVSNPRWVSIPSCGEDWVYCSLCSPTILDIASSASFNI